MRHPPDTECEKKIFRALPNGLLQSWPVAGPVLIPVHRYAIGVPLEHNRYAIGLASVAASKHKNMLLGVPLPSTQAHDIYPLPITLPPR